MYVYVRVCLCIMKAAIDGEAEGCRNRISSKSHKQNAGMKAVLQCSHENTACTCVCVCVCVRVCGGALNTSGTAVCTGVTHLTVGHVRVIESRCACAEPPLQNACIFIITTYQPA